LFSLLYYLRPGDPCLPQLAGAAAGATPAAGTILTFQRHFSL